MNYNQLKCDIARIWKMKIVNIIPVVIELWGKS